MPRSVYRFVLFSGCAEPLARRFELAPDLAEDRKGLVGDLVRLDLPAGRGRLKLPLEDGGVLALKHQQAAQVRVDVGQLEHVRLQVCGLR